MQYSDYQNSPSSEKVVLAILEASKRLMGWVVHSGSVYKLVNFDKAVIREITDNNTVYTAVASLGAVAAGKYYLDQSVQTLYLQTSDSSNPNGKFLACKIQLFFANVPISLPYDLDAGFDVFWEPLLKPSSVFGVSIDTVNQTNEAIEGTGSLTLQNDYDFWPENYDKYFFENQDCHLYSYNRGLDPSEAKLIFKGKVLKKAFTNTTITFSLQDQIRQLQADIPLAVIGDLNERESSDLTLAKQRMVLGRVFGHRPTNIDQVLDGYPVTGTISISLSGTTITGSGTAFLNELSPDDQVILNGQTYTIATVTNNTTADITEPFATGSSISGGTTVVVPDRPKRFINREFHVAGHTVREPVTATETGCDVSNLFVTDTTDIYAGDTIYVGTLGSGEVATVQTVYGRNYLKLSTSLALVPGVGTQVIRPAVQNVRIDNINLIYYRDYTFDASTGILELRDIAEANAAPIFQIAQSATFTSSSRTVTGSGFKNTIFPDYMVGVVGQTDFFEVSAVASDTSLTLKTPATFTATANLRYRSFVYDEGTNVLSLDCLGKTDDGTTTGVLLKTAPAIAKHLLEDAGLTDDLDIASFDAAEEIAYQHIGIVIPTGYSDTNETSYRDALNSINSSVLGTLIQNVDLDIGYHVIRPRKVAAAIFRESDILSFDLNATAETAIETTIVEYKKKEYDYLVQQESLQTKQTTSDISNYILNLETSKTYTTYLVDETHAQLMADRLSFMLSSSIGKLTFTSKLQAATLQIGDIIEVEHRKFFERYGGSSRRKLLMVESVKRDGSSVQIEATDLSNTFNRVACINDFSTSWTSAIEDDLLYGGYWTDQYGLINSDEQSFSTNLIF